MSAGVQGSSSKIAKISDQACGSSITTNTVYSVSRSGAETFWVVDLSGTAPGSFSIAQSFKGIIAQQRAGRRGGNGSLRGHRADSRGSNPDGAVERRAAQILFFTFFMCFYGFMCFYEDLR